MTVDTLITDVSDRPIETSPKGERYVVVSFREAAGKVTGAPEGVEVWEAMSPAEREIADLRDVAVELAERANKAEFAADYDRVAAGLKFIELRAMVQATGASWEKWFVQNVHSVNIRTAQRYMALASRPTETPAQPPSPTAEQPKAATGDDETTAVAPKETLGKRDGSPRKRLVAIVSKLSESEAEEVLAMVEKWRAKR